MTAAHSPQAFAQMQDNARDYRIGCILNEVDHFTEYEWQNARALLQKRRWSDEDITAAFARKSAATEAKHKQAPEVTE